MKRVRVLHVIDTLGFGGGAESNFAAMVSAITGLDQHVVHLCPEDHYAAGLRAHGITVERVAYKGPASSAHVVRRLAQLADAADVVHTQTTLSDIFGRAAAFARRPTVTTVQIPAFEPEIMKNYSTLGKAKAAALWLGDTLLSRRAAHMVAVSEYVRSTVVDHLRVPRERTSVIYNAVAVDELGPLPPAERSELRRELGLGDQDFVIISVGKLSWIKGQEVLVEALPEILRRVPNAVLLIPGRGDRRDAIAAAATRLGVSSRVRLLGLRSDLRRILGVADLFALASLTEGLSLAVAEAMASSLPCVLSAIPPHQEMAARLSEAGPGPVDGLLVPERTGAAYAAAIARIALDGGLRADLGRRGRVAAERHFNVAVTAPALEAVLRAAARPRR